MSDQYSRRKFLRQAAIAAPLAAIPYVFTTKAAAASEFRSKNDRPMIGAIGVGGQGLGVLRQAAAFGDVVAVCDVDENHAAGAKAIFQDKPQTYRDYRKLLERDDLDVIVNGTPDHWHTAVVVHACRAGKDVYTEKPLTLTIDEGKLMRDVVGETKRVVQVGTQQRSVEQFQTAVELVRNGRIGKLKQVWVALPYYSTKGGPFESTPVPSDLDWERYQGQAPERAFCPQRTHKNFRWWYEYAGGIVTDWGNHHVDIAQWGMDCEQTGPVSVDARGLFPNAKGPQFYNTPDRFFARMRYANGIELLYFASLNLRSSFGQVEKHVDTTKEQMQWMFGENVPEEIKTFNRDGIMFIGDRGRVFVNRGGVYGKPAEQLPENPLSSDAWRVRPSNDHMANFFQCVKSRDEPVSPVRIQHRTVTTCHLTNIAIRSGRPIRWDPETESIVGDRDAAAMQSREPREGFAV